MTRHRTTFIRDGDLAPAICHHWTSALSESYKQNWRPSVFKCAAAGRAWQLISTTNTLAFYSLIFTRRLITC
jgi:hypothetical protein